MLSTKKQLLTVRETINPFIHNTPILTSQSINEITGINLFFKCENFQRMGAFKMRGAVNAIMELTEEQKAKGVATHSSGNFAQAVALSAKKIGIKSFIVMPSSATAIKKAAVIGYGAEVFISEPTLDGREKLLDKVIQKTGATFIHPSNNTNVILGNSTTAQEMIEEIDDLDYLLTPIGGGGLVAGTALAVHHFSPNTIVMAGEPRGADDAYRSLLVGKILTNQNPNTIADGLRTHLGDKNFPIIQKLVKKIIRVEEIEIITAMRLIWERMKIIIEPSSAVPIAAIYKEKKFFKDKKVGIIITGGNVDLKALPF